MDLGEALTAVEEAVRSGSGARTLDALLAAWRLRRLGELADAIEALSRRYEAVVPPIAGKTERTRYEQLLDRVAKKKSTDVGSIVAELPSATVIRVRDHTDRLAVMDPDPRVARGLFDHVAKRRYNLHNTVWTGIFRELRRHGDVRTHAMLAALPTPSGDSSAEQGFAARIKAALASLPSSLPVSDEERARIDAIAGALGGLELDLPADAPAPKASGGDEGALLAQVAASPDDDDARLVLADLYAERGDVRGELINLQLKKERTAKDLKREKEILKKHIVELLGPLEQVVDRKTCRFSRGFLEHAAVKLKTAAQRRELFGHPMLATLRSVASRDAALVRSLPNVEAVTELSWKAFVELAHGAPLPRIRRVAVDTTISDPGTTGLSALTGLPSLEEASFAFYGMDGEYTNQSWQWILAQGKGALATKRLVVDTDVFRGRIAGALSSLDDHPAVQALSLRIRRGSRRAIDLEVDITRAASGYVATIASEEYSLLDLSQIFGANERRDLRIVVKPMAKGTSTGLEWLEKEYGPRIVR